MKNLKTFDQIPTLKYYPLIGHAYLFMPRGKYKTERLTEAIVDISKTLGSIFRLKLGGKWMVITTDADNAQKLYRNEGTKPNRPSFPALIHYRKKAFGSVGVVPGNGEEWYRMRKGVTPLLKTNLIEQYKNKQIDIAKDFVQYIKEHRDKNNVLKDIFEHLLKFSIEAISIVVPGHRFSCLSTKSNPDTEAIIAASKDFMDGLYKTLIEPPIWKLIKTTSYKQLVSSHEIIHRILKQYFEQQYYKFQTNPEEFQIRQPFMHTLFSNQNLSWEDKIMLTIELFLGGIDATSTTIAFTLHYLSLNQDIQNLARNSCKKENNFEFLNACVRETLRMSATGGANSRFIVNDTEMSGYLIPKETLVLVFNSAISRDPKYFKEPDTYLPQRWIGEAKRDYHKFASLPFGHGARMCPGRRLAEKEIVILLKEILNAFYLEPTDTSEVGMVYRMNRIPDRSIDMKFINTNH